MPHGLQEAALTTAGAWSMTNGPDRRARSEEPPQAKSSQSLLIRKEKEEAEKPSLTADRAVTVTRALSGERLSAFCYLKSSFHRFYKVTPTPKILLGAGSKTCALVSNSGALLARTDGAEIDAHDIVFRFNMAPTNGFEANVGYKTTFRLGSYFPPDCDHKVCYTFPKGEVWKQIPKKAKIANIRGLLHRQIRPALKNQSQGLSSGFHGMLHALSTCGFVDTYELTPSKGAGKYPYHYWEQGDQTDDVKHHRHSSGNRADKNDWHAYAEAEHELWRWLATNSEASIDETGKATLPSFDSVTCS
jgi:hypothetical protein